MQRLKLSFLLVIGVLLMGLQGCASVSEAQQQQPVVYKNEEPNPEHKKLMHRYAVDVNKELHRLVANRSLRYPSEAYYKQSQGLVELDVVVYGGYPEIKTTYNEGPGFFIPAAKLMLERAVRKAWVPDELHSKNFAFTISVQFKTEDSGGVILTTLY